MRKTSILLGAGLVLAGCSEYSPVVGPDESAPMFSQNAQEDRFIVVFAPTVGDPNALTEALIRGNGGVEHYRYRHALRGFAATLPASAVEGIRRNPNVALVEPDGVMSIVVTQTNATWGLDRIDQRSLPLSTTYTYDQAGAGVHAYIIDTGIRSTHAEFSGRTGNGFTAISTGGTEDCHGHGTHVSGTVGGTTYGVAKSVTLHAVRVLNCSGSGATSGVIAGVDWVTGNAVKPAVANMSLGGSASSALDNAITNSVNSGVTYAVAAGNSNANACNFSPSRAAAALTVGSTTTSDARSSFSNFGTCLDLFAPGSGITSAWSTSNTATNTISGTSMASPHVAGVAALFLSIQGNGNASPATVAQAISNNATTGVVGNAGTGSPNRLLFSLFSGGPPDPPPAGGAVRVANLTATTSTAGPNWRANVTVTVRGGSSDALVSGALVSANWSTGGTASCTTGAAGTCTIQSAQLKRGVTSTTFGVTGISAAGFTYNPALNTVTSITVDKP